MIQRPQTLFLILSIIGMGVFLALNSWVKTTADSTVLTNAFQIVELKGSLASNKKEIFYIAVLAVLSLGVSVFSIFQYKNRVRQMLLVAFNSLLIAAALGVMAYHIKYDAMLMGDVSAAGVWSYGYYGGFVALASNWLANRFIRKDEKLVKSADRMR